MSEKLYGICENKCLKEVLPKNKTYSRDEANELLANKSDSSHNHDDRYYTESEVDSKLANKSDSSHTHDGRYYTETEINTKLANYKLKGDFAVITGNIVADGETNDTIISYPSGFNYNNCVVISGGIENAGNSNCSVGCTFDSASYVRGGLPLAVSLRTSDIVIRAKNIQLVDGENSMVKAIAASATPFKYKIVLMKV